MRALVYNGPRNVSVKDVPDPRIEHPNDVLVRITSTNICGSDLHMYEGRTDMEPGRVLGHENLGEIVEIGDAVRMLNVGDMVCVPFNVSCGFCKNCERGYTATCLTMNPGHAGAGYGYAGMGPYEGGQAEYLRVPYADFNCLLLPEDAVDRQAEYVMLADIFPTGYQATEWARVKPGGSVVIYGAGPVGLMACYSSILKGAEKVIVVDRLADRLELVRKIGGVPIDDSHDTAIEQVLELTNGEGADGGCECVGYHAHDPEGEEHPNMTLNDLVQCIRPTGSLGVVGVFAEDPKSHDALARHGQVAFDFAAFFERGLSLRCGQASVKQFNRPLMELIRSGRANPSFLVSHEMSLEDAPEAYRHFGARHDGWTKIILKPQMPAKERAAAA